MKMDKPDDTERLRQRAVEAMFGYLRDMCRGGILVDRDSRIAWIDEKYKKVLGVDDSSVGRPIEEVIPQSRMRQVVESGQPILLDIMNFEERAFVVIRLPMRDDDGVVVGACGFVLVDEPDHLKPLCAKFQRLRQRVADAEKALALERRAKYTFSQVIGVSDAINNVKSLARRAAQIGSTVLLLGETGTGKELLAQAIHSASARANGPMVGINVAAVPEGLLEAEFFGAAPGAYTGASRGGRDGKFLIANGGTLFLDEIGDMPLPVQAKLLRVLQEREIEPLGDNRIIPIDVRIIAASSRDLAALVRAGSFRADLYYRLNVVPIVMPSLRDRREDIPTIADHILEQLAIAYGPPTRTLSAGAIDALQACDWPGNVRELHNVLERTLSLTDDWALNAQHIQAALGHSDSLSSTVKSADKPAGNAEIMQPLAELLADAERSAIAAALTQARGIKSKAAKLLGISRGTLYERLAALNIVEEAGAGDQTRIHG
jgi:transcriptional regulator with PAS, ATPase and Fis domain